jgi:hypothetical protein
MPVPSSQILGAAILLAALAATARADTIGARCEIVPKGSDRVSAMLPCTF